MMALRLSVKAFRSQNTCRLKRQLATFASTNAFPTAVNNNHLSDKRLSSFMTKSSCWTATARCSSAATAMTPSGDTSKIPILLADIGEGIAEVEIMNWMVQVGDVIQEFDPLVQVQSDKATVEITSRYAGRIVQLQANVGDMVAVGTPLAFIEVEGQTNHHAQPIKEAQQAEPASSPSKAKRHESHVDAVGGVETNYSESDSVEQEEDILEDPVYDNAQIFNSSPSVLTTPAVRKLAMDHQLDLSQIPGTGPQGRVLKLDVLRYLEEKEQKYQQLQRDRVEGAQPLPGTTAPTNNKQLQPPTEDDGSQIVPLRGYHRLMVQTMTRALQIPHMVYSDEVNLNSLLDLRQGLLKEQRHRKVDNFPLPVLVFAIKALSLALKEYPVVNSTLNAAENKDHLPASITMHANHNIGVAMDTPRGLVVPVLRRCQDLSLREMALELERLKQAARTSQLTEHDLSGATITLSNIGAIGGTYMSPIITPPQVVILAMGRAQRLPRFVESHEGNDSSDDDDDDVDSLQVQAVHVLPISWGGDHRVLDGATLARFSNQWKYYMESPTSMLLHLK